MDPTSVGSFSLGAVVGWLLYYFVRNFRTFSPQTLAATCVGILGAPLLRFLGSSPSMENAPFWYFMGIGFGFFLFALYLGFLLWLLHTERIDQERFNFYGRSAGGASISTQRRFSMLMRSLDAFEEGTISEKQLRQKVRRSGLSRASYGKVRWLQGEDHPDYGDKTMEGPSFRRFKKAVARIRKFESLKLPELLRKQAQKGPISELMDKYVAAPDSVEEQFDEAMSAVEQFVAGRIDELEARKKVVRSCLTLLDFEKIVLENRATPTFAPILPLVDKFLQSGLYMYLECTKRERRRLVRQITQRRQQTRGLADHLAISRSSQDAIP